MRIQLAIASLIAQAYALTYQFTNPVAGVTWTAGQTATITWIAATPAISNVRSIKIELVAGPANAVTVIAPVADNVQPGTTSIQFPVPANWENKPDYALRITAIGANGEKDENYSARFAVTGGNPNAPAPGAPAPGKENAKPQPASASTVQGSLMAAGAAAVVGLMM